MDLSNFTQNSEIAKSSANTNILENNNIKVDFLLDEEKKDIEKELLNSLNKTDNKPSSEVKPEVKLEVKPSLIATTVPKEVTKLKLVEQFIELQKSQGEVKYSANKLKHMKRDDIIQLIANYSNQILIGETAQKGLENLGSDGAPSTRLPEINSENPSVQSTPVLTSVSQEQLDVVANGIFGINMALISILETGSHALKEKTGNVALLESWAERAAQKKEAFIFIFKQIYKDYKNEIDKYLSPVAQYGIIMAQTATETIIINIKKNKEQSKQDCVTH